MRLNLNHYQAVCLYFKSGSIPPTNVSGLKSMTLFWILDGLSTWFYLLAAVYETKSKQHSLLTCNGYLIDLTSVFSIGRAVEFLASVLTMVEPTSSPFHTTVQEPEAPRVNISISFSHGNRLLFVWLKVWLVVFMIRIGKPKCPLY